MMLDRLVERVEDRREAFEDVDAPLELGQLELEAARDDLLAEVEEVAQHRRAGSSRSGPGDLRVRRRHQAGQVDVEVRLLSGVCL